MLEAESRTEPARTWRVDYTRPGVDPYWEVLRDPENHRLDR